MTYSLMKINAHKAGLIAAVFLGFIGLMFTTIVFSFAEDISPAPSLFESTYIQLALIYNAVLGYICVSLFCCMYNLLAKWNIKFEFTINEIDKIDLK